MSLNFKILDLFAGIGGFSLASSWLGWQTAAFVEKNAFCQKVLRKNFGQDIDIYDDITTFSGKPFRGRIDIVSGGFPCQPHSVAGKRKGRADERFLWNEMLRVIQECQPRWVVAENVHGLLSDEGGLVFEGVCADLEMANYSVQSFIVPACAVNAPHKRNRIWIIAHSNGVRWFNEQKAIRQIIQDKIGQLSPSQQSRNVEQCGVSEYGSITSNTNDEQCQKARLPLREIKSKQERTNFERGSWIETATEFCRDNDGLPNRVDRLKSLGNAIVPQIAFEIFKAIEHAETI